MSPSRIAALPAGAPGSTRHSCLVFASALLVFLSAVSIAGAQDIAQDGQGVAWAIGNALLVFNGKVWTPAPVVFPADGGNPVEGNPMSLARMQDGSMACVWQLPDGRLAVTRHPSASETGPIGVCPGKIENSGLKSPPFADSHNRLWITDAKPDIYRADPDGRVALACSIKPEQLISANDIKAHYANVFATEDGHGRVWAWSNSRAGGMNGAALRGVLIFDGGRIVQREKFAGIHAARFSFIGRKDSKSMWVGAMTEGLFSVDIDSLVATAIAPPDPGAFDCVQKVFATGDDLFVIAGDILKSALWRLQRGKWACLINGVDNRPNPAFEFGRPWLRCGADTILCSYDAAPWLIHEDGMVERLDFRHGYNLEDARSICLLSDGRLLAEGARGHVFCGKVSLAPPDPAKPARATELVYAHHGWTTDPGGNAWVILSDKGNVLSQWDGARWREHPFPADIQHLYFLGAGVDTRGRVWLLPNGGMTAFFDPHTGQWCTFPDLETALIKLKADPPRFAGEPPEFCAPEYSAGLVRIAFRALPWHVTYFDGKQWHRWKRSDIETGADPNHFTLGSPFFDKSDHLCVCIGDKTWQLDDQGHWAQRVVELKNPGDDHAETPRHKRIVPPEGCVTDSPDSIAADNHGTIWLTWQRKLYKCANGGCAEVFSDGEPDPFADRRKIMEAWVDRKGNAFLKTSFDKCIMIRAAPNGPARP